MGERVAAGVTRVARKSWILIPTQVSFDREKPCDTGHLFPGIALGIGKERLTAVTRSFAHQAANQLGNFGADWDLPRLLSFRGVNTPHRPPRRLIDMFRLESGKLAEGT